MRAFKTRYKVQGQDELIYDSDDNFEYVSKHGVIALCDGGMKFVEKSIPCTGVKDKNGADIYERDIVKFIHGGLVVVGIVEWSKCYLTWGIIGIEDGGVYDDLCEFIGSEFEIEVIGNELENKELML